MSNLNAFECCVNEKSCAQNFRKRQIAEHRNNHFKFRNTQYANYAVVMHIKYLKTDVKCNILLLTQIQTQKMVFWRFILFLYIHLLNTAF